MYALPRGLIVLGVLLLTNAALVSARQSAEWAPVPSGTDLLRPAYWEGFASAVAEGGVVSIGSLNEPVVRVLQYGPRIRPDGDFGVVVSMQSVTSDLGAISLVDSVPEDAQWPGVRRLDVGLQEGSVVVQVFDGIRAEPVEWYRLASDAPLGPVTVEVRRVAGEFVVTVSGAEELRLADPGLFQSGEIMLGARVQGDNELTLSELSVHAPMGRLSSTRVDRCAPARLLITGSDASDTQTGMWFLWPDEGTLRQVESSTRQTSVLVAVSPDARWAAYYQRSSQAPSDRFIADTWVIDLATDERFRLVEQSTPLGWITDSSAVVLADRPAVMALVPGGELRPTGAPLVTGDAMKAIDSPDGRLRAVITRGMLGSATGVDILDRNAGERLMNIPTGRGAITLAWSPDSTHLAFTSSRGGQNALLWRLQIANVLERRVFTVESTGDMQIHSVVWTPPLPACR